MRGAAWACVLGLAGCFDGDGANGLPCANDAQCGVGVRCIDGFCGGRPAGETTAGTATAGSTDATSISATTAGSDASATTDGDSTTGDPGQCPHVAQESAKCADNVRGTLTNVEFTSYEVVIDGQGAPIGAVAGRFFGDETVGFAVAHSGTGFVTLHRYDGNSGFEAVVSEAIEPEAKDIASGDLDADGVDDLVVVNSATQNLDVFWGMSKTGFRAHDSPPTGFPDGWSVDVSDFVEDADCGAEIAVSASSGALHLLDLPGPGFPLDQLAFAGEVGLSPWETRAVQLDIDHTAEILVVDSDDENSTPGLDPVLTFDVDGSGLTSSAVTPMFENPYAAVIDDVTNDNIADLVVIEKRVDDAPEQSTQPGALTVCPGNLDTGEFECWPSISTVVSPNALAIADFDCNGDPDIVVAGAGHDTNGNPGQVEIFWGALTARSTGTVILQPIHSASRIAVGDFTGDGVPDLAIPAYASDGGGSLTVVLSPGGTFTSARAVNDRWRRRSSP